MISVREVFKSFGRVRAVRGVSLELEPGQVAGLLGPNGAGKTTTIRMITGFLPPDSGRVSIDTHDTLSDSREARQRIGYLPESAPLYEEMTPSGYLHYRARLFRMGRSDRRKGVNAALDRCGLTQVRNRRIGHLSKGYRQRVGLASALLHDPPVLVLDEPTNGLDPSQIREVRGLVRELGQERTMLVSSHILPEIERLCDRVIVVAGGTVRADGSPESLIERTGAARSYVVECRGGSQPSGPGGWVRSVPGVDRVTPEPTDDSGWERLVVRCAPGAPDLREAIAKAASGAGVTVRELRRERGSLEQVFLDLIEQDGAERS